tara:strand:+ start:2489 stop:2749 length:261 start_codon:yes stop_codon:yes gene_type:complete
MNKFEEALHSLHEQRVQKLKVDKVLAQLNNGTEEEKEYAEILENALVNSSYNNQTIVDALKAVDIEVSLSAVRTWRNRKNGQGKSQ